MTVLKITDLCTNYGAIKALKGISMEVDDGELIAFIGNNGAGKSTLLNTITGRVKAASGKVDFMGTDITNMVPHKIVQMGVTMSPEGREVFPALTVDENLRLGAYTMTDQKRVSEIYDRVMNLFPRLLERRNQVVGTLSGGEQQMLAMGRAMMSDPKLLLLDEPSMGLAPNYVQMIFEIVKELNREGMTILLVEQNANQALKVSDRAYVIETGNIVLSGLSSDIRKSDMVRKAYLGIN